MALRAILRLIISHMDNDEDIGAEVWGVEGWLEDDDLTIPLETEEDN